MKHIIYQVLPRLWGNGKFSAWHKAQFDYLKSLGVDCIWFTGIPRHASGQAFVKGDPGSPYAVSDWMDTNPYLADDASCRIEEFRKLVSRVHRSGLKVICDFIPNHVARNYSGPVPNCGYCDYDWTDTLKVDYSDPSAAAHLCDALRFWAALGVDGFRCDMVELVPQDALKHIISTLKGEYPALIFIAEVYRKESYRSYTDYVGFDYLYDKSGIYDILRSVVCGKCSAREITGNWLSLGGIEDRMLNFLENHDEQRIASPRFASSPSRAYAALAVATLFNGASFMLYFGQEAGEDASEGAEGRTSIFNWAEPKSVKHICRYIRNGKGLDRNEASVLAHYRELLSLCTTPLYSTGEKWDLCYCQNDPRFDADRHFAFVRYNNAEASLVFCNFGGSADSLEINLPEELVRKLPFRVAPVQPVSAEACGYAIVSLNSI